MVGLEYSTPTPKNGDCFFEAVSDQLIRLGLQRQNPAVLRQNVIDFLEHNPALEQEDGHIHWNNFVENDDVKAYLTRMSKKGEWADHVVVLGMSAVLKCNIIIITSSPNTHPDDNIIWINCNNASADLLLGHIWENHYQSLRPFYLKPKTG
ncbi:uncharacterized protein LOC134694073 [Mytilus trossulus]|uniref:uncharacterized protein LOC134694073 n=1 Tax=Mytilus trossulus TaxID=6551 RepID=UPI00300437F0